MSEIASVVDRTRKAFAVASAIEAELAHHPDSASLQVNLAASLKMAQQSQSQLLRFAETARIEVCNYRLLPEATQSYGLPYVSRSMMEYQNLFSQIHDAKKNGPKVRAVINKEAQDESTLEFAYSYSGSLGMVLLAQSERDLLAGNLDPSIDSLFEVMDLDTRAGVRHVASELGGAVVKRIYDWSDANIKGGFAADVRWNRSDGRQLGEVIPRARMENIVGLVEATSDQVTREFPVVGYLIGGHLHTKSFHLVVPDGEAYRGYRSADFYSEVDMTLGKQYAAVVRVTTTVHYATEKVERKEELVRLMQAPEGDLITSA